MSSLPAELPSPTPIPTPVEFPVVWDDPSDAFMFWTNDRMHFPRPILALECEVWAAFMEGVNSAGETYAFPIRQRFRRINTYLYQAVIPVVPPEQMEANGQIGQELMAKGIEQLPDKWQREWLPEVQGILDRWRAFPLSTASGAELAAHFEQTMAMAARLGDIHFQAVLPGYMPLGLFEEYFCELFPDRKPFDAYRLLQGFDNKTLETDRALFDLARRATLNSTLLTLIQETEPQALRGALEQSADGRAFLADLRRYLDEYGQRGETWSIAEPSWIEDPTPVLKTLRDYTRDGAHDPHVEMRRLAAERNTAIADARTQLIGYPRAVVERFESLLESAQFGNVLSEDHNFWIDFRGFHQVRRVVVACGERLAASGAIASAEDIWHLTSADVLRALRSSAPGDLRPIVDGARAEVARFAAIARPPALGSQPPGAPPDDAMGRVMGRFFGTPPPPAAETDVIRGHAGSPGRVTGRARVVRALTDAVKLQPGEVLVAETTAPPWTPLFGTAAAVVTDTGGILCHCAVVAREYGIPAVVGAVVATRRVRDGQLLEIDGDAGTIRLLD